MSSLVPSPPPQLLSLAVYTNSWRGPGKKNYHVIYATATSHMLVCKFCSLGPRRTLAWERDWNYYAPVATISINSAWKEIIYIEMDGIWCGGLMYADEIVLLTETGDKLQKMLDVVGHYAQEWKFRFNARKSKTMVVGANNEESWSISGRGNSIQIPRCLAGSEDERECADGENEREG